MNVVSSCRVLSSLIVFAPHHCLSAGPGRHYCFRVGPNQKTCPLLAPLQGTRHSLVALAHRLSPKDKLTSTKRAALRSRRNGNCLLARAKIVGIQNDCSHQSLASDHLHHWHKTSRLTRATRRQGLDDGGVDDGGVRVSADNGGGA